MIKGENKTPFSQLALEKNFLVSLESLGYDNGVVKMVMIMVIVKYMFTHSHKTGNTHRSKKQVPAVPGNRKKQVFF